MRMFLPTTLVLIIVEIKGQVPGTCDIVKKSCSEEECNLQLTVYSKESVVGVSWFRDQKEIKPDSIRMYQYTSSYNVMELTCLGQMKCMQSTFHLIIKPFLPSDYGRYRASLTAGNKTQIACQADFILKLPGAFEATTAKSDTIEMKTNYLYMGIGIVAGCAVLIVILCVSVILLIRRNRRTKGTVSNLHTANRNTNIKDNRKPSAVPSHHTYASISSDVLRYENLGERRPTKEGYAIPNNQIIEEDSSAYLKPGRHSSLTAPLHSEDDISDFSYTMDSAFSSSSFASEIDNANAHPQYITGRVPEQGRELHFSNEEYQATYAVPVIACTNTETKETKEKISEYQNIRKVRRLT